MTVAACVIGWPVGHSRSPLIHGHWLEHYGIDGVYTKEEVRPEELAAFLKSMPARGLAGCNVTVPHKARALELADKADQTARSIGAANTLWLEHGVLCATNTDAHGFLANLDEGAPGWDGRARRAVVLGAGGAARAVLHALLGRKLGGVTVVNRTRYWAEAIAAHFGARVSVRDWHERAAALEDCGLLVNTTTLGMTNAPELDLDLARLPLDAVVCDIVYTPLETGLLKRAKARSLVAVDGLGMLLHQAVPGFEKWFGVRPEVTDELRALIVADLESERPC